MQKEMKQHITYGLVLALIFVGTIFYQNSLIEETKQTLMDQIEQLRAEVRDLQTETKELEAKDESLEKSVEDLDMTVDEQGKQITGELNELRVETKQQAAALQETIEDLQGEYQDFSAVIEDVVPGVVRVQTNVGSGSGFHIGNGNIVTNYHVIDGASAARIVTHDGKQHAVRIIGSDRNADISVLQINSSRYTRLRFGNSDDVRVGQKAIAIGNPGGLDFTVTQGIISSTDRKDEKGNEYTQIDVPINPGNSGGPLIDSNGKVIGVNTLKLSGFEGVGFALDSNYVDEIVDEIIE